MALALEDYAGAQCWLGYQPKYLKTSVGPGLDTSGWSELVLPLEDTARALVLLLPDEEEKTHYFLLLADCSVHLFICLFLVQFKTLLFLLKLQLVQLVWQKPTR